jgi:hypothetical protein
MGQRAVHEAVATALEGLEPETTMAGIRAASGGLTWGVGRPRGTRTHHPRIC